MSHAAISSAEEGSQRVPVRRMKGLVGYDDILPWLDQAVAYEKHSAGWQQCRSRLLAADADSLFQQSDETQDDRLREWRDDECPLRRGIDYAHFFWELDSWTEYWDIYHPETHGRFYFGDDDHAGLLTEFLPSPSNPRNPVFAAWKRLALYF